MTRGTWAVACFVVSLLFAAIGVAAGTGGDHAGGITAMVIALAALLLGTALWRK